MSEIKWRKPEWEHFTMARPGLHITHWEKLRIRLWTFFGKQTRAVKIVIAAMKRAYE